MSPTAQQLGQHLRQTQSLTPELRAQFFAASPRDAVEAAVLGYWPTIVVPLLIERGPDVVPALREAAQEALSRPRRQPFEGTIVLWALRAITGVPLEPSYAPLLQSDLSSTAPHLEIFAAQLDLLRTLPLPLRESMVCPADGSIAWAYLEVCESTAVAEAVVRALGRRTTTGNDLNLIAAAAAMGSVLRAPLEAALREPAAGNRAPRVAVLARLRDPQAKPTLESLRRDPELEVRRWALDGLISLRRGSTLDLHDDLEALYARVRQGAQWSMLWDGLFDRLTGRGLALSAITEHLSTQSLAERRDRQEPGPKPYGSSPAFRQALVRLSADASSIAGSIAAEHVLGVPADRSPREFLCDPLLIREPSLIAAIASALAQRLGDTECSAHDPHLFDWLARDAPRVPSIEAVMDRGLDHPDPDVRMVCEAALRPPVHTPPADPWGALPERLEALTRFTQWGALECRIHDRPAGRLYVFCPAEDAPSQQPCWIECSLPADATLRDVLASSEDTVDPRPLEPRAVPWSDARAILDQVFEFDRDVGLGTQIAHAIDRVLVIFKALDLRPLDLGRSVYEVAWDVGFAFESDRYRGTLWYLNDQ